MDDIGGEYWTGRRRKRTGPRGRSTFEAVPSATGQKLMDSGKFGAAERNTFGYRRKKKFAARLLQRELGMGSYGVRSVSNSLISMVCLELPGRLLAPVLTLCRTWFPRTMPT